MKIYFIAVITMLLAAPIVFAGDIEIQSTVTPSIVAPGDNGYIELTIIDTGTSTFDSIKLKSLTIDSPLVLTDTSFRKDFGSLESAKSVSDIFRFSVPANAEPGFYRLMFKISACESTVCKDYIQNSIITVQSQPIIKVTSVSPDSLRAGENTYLNFTLSNVGTSTAKSISFVWTTSTNLILPVGTDNKILINEMGVGSSKTLSSRIAVSPSITPDVYPITVQLSYKDQLGNSINQSSIVGMVVGGGTDFEITLDQSSGTSSLYISNVGTNTATSVSVSIPEQSEFSVTGSSTAFIGNLNPGDYTIASFELTQRLVRQNATGGSEVNSLIVEISYTDTNGNRLTVQKNVLSGSSTAGTMNMSQGQMSQFYGAPGEFQRSRGGNNTLLYVAIVAVGVVAVVLFLKFRKRIKPALARKFSHK
jgi:hypothetical protein